MKLNAFYTTQFRKDFKQCVKRGYDMQLIRHVMESLENQETLPPKNKDHFLTGNYTGFRECHVQPDWLLIYQVSNESIVFDRTGTHSDLF